MANKGVSSRVVYKQNKRFSPMVSKALRYSLERAGLIFEKNTKKLITEDNHVVTGRYRASINHNVKDGIPRDTVSESKGDDGIHRFTEAGKTLEIGTNVEYAVSLEKRFNLISRGMNISEKEMVEEFNDSFNNFLKKNR